MIEEKPALNKLKFKLKLQTIPNKSKYLTKQDQGITPLTTTNEVPCSAMLETLESFKEKYKILEQVGQGANGVVYRCEHIKSKRIYAVKRSRCDIQIMANVKASYNHTKKLTHPGVIYYKGLYVIPHKRVSYLVMEYFDHPQISKAKIHDQKQMANIVYQLLEAVAYMHSEGVCHRDIKPDNILYDQKEKQIKVTDFGESKQIKDGRIVKQMMTCTGTLQYKAPELFRGGVYDQLIDQWAAGVTIYELITGRKPFDSEYKATIIENIESCNVSFEQEFWNKHPYIWAKKLISELLCPREKRLSAKKALSSLWFEGHSKTLASIAPTTYKRATSVNITDYSMIGEEEMKKSKDKKNNVHNWNILNNKEGLIDSDQFIEDDEESEQQKNNVKIVTQSSTECKSPLKEHEESLKGKQLQKDKDKEYSKQC